MRQGMLPEEAAEIVVNEHLADSNIRNFSLLENIPARIAGNSGFRLMFVYTDADGLVLRPFCGFINGNTFITSAMPQTRKSIFRRT
jgi:hypothetical protein